MLLRIALVGGGLATIPIAATYLSQNKLTKANLATSESQNTTIFVNELPLYQEPPHVQLEYVQEKVGLLEENIIPVRRVLMTGIDKCQKYIDMVSKTQAATSATLKDFMRYLREDSGAVPRGTFITVAGLGGIVAGYRRGVFRKTLYASLGMTGAAAVCYPSQAVDLSKQAWILTRDQAKELWNQGSTSKAPEQEVASKNDEGESPKEAPKDDKTSTDKDTLKVVEKSDLTPETTPQVDHGMSKPEDKDMYSTRSS